MTIQTKNDDYAVGEQKHKVLHCGDCDHTWVHYFKGRVELETDEHGCLPCPNCATPTLCLV